MRNIEVQVIDSGYGNPEYMMLFLAKLTQRSHKISTMDDLLELYDETFCTEKERAKSTIESIVKLPHGTIKRFTPITVAIVGASRRFLAQARTHQVGFNYVSGSLQYSNYTDKGNFVVPYEILAADGDLMEHARKNCLCPGHAIDAAIEKDYIKACEDAMEVYKEIANSVSNDAAGYVAPQGLRNVLIMQGNHESWLNFLRARTCNRNTKETQYVSLLIWEALISQTIGGDTMFKYAGPDCLHGQCREGKMSCGDWSISGCVKAEAPVCILERNFKYAYNCRRT